MTNPLSELNDALAGTGSDVSIGLVRVKSGRSSAGAGTIWHSDGLIVTAAHVLENGPFSVRLQDGTELPAALLATDWERDVAALTVQASGLLAVQLGDSSRLRPGEWVGALGFPWGRESRLVAGSVSGTDCLSEKSVRRRGRHHEHPKRDWVVVDLRLRPGFSGGPLFDARGRLVGVNTVMTGPRMGVAVPVDIAKRFLNEVIPAAASAA